MKGDLHIHSNCSDGIYSPKELVKQAKDLGLNVISICDHDTTSGINDAKEAGNKLSIKVIEGVEINTNFKEEEVHILGYFFDLKNDFLNEKLKYLRESREKRAEKIVKKLNSLGIKINIQQVMEKAKGESIGRPHIAKVLVDNGYAITEEEAFKKYIDGEAPGYVPRYKFSPKEALELILQAKGIPILAHPGFLKDDKIIFDLIKNGLMGIEVYYARHTKEQIEYYKKFSESYGLLITGGSDFHGAGSVMSSPMSAFEIPLWIEERIS